MRFVICLLLGVMCAGLTAAGEPPPLDEYDSNDRVVAAPMPEQLAELQRDFTFQKRLINPLAIYDLMDNLANPTEPGPSALNVAGTVGDGYKYRTEYTTDAMLKSASVDFKEPAFIRVPFFSYMYHGRLATGAQVLRTSYCGGGTGIFESLLIVESTTEFQYDRQGTRRPVLVIKRRGEFDLGDRSGAEIQLQPKENSIIIRSQNNPDRQIRLQ